MYRLIKITHPIARRDKACIWCGQTIHAGERYCHEISVYEEFQNHHWHLECREAGCEHFREEAEFTPYDNERPLQRSMV